MRLKFELVTWNLKAVCSTAITSVSVTAQWAHCGDKETLFDVTCDGSGPSQTHA
jgi:hypothetical protein